MTLLEAITEGYLLATGKSTLPSSGSSKYNRLIALAKKCYRDWQTETGVEWNSLYEVVSAGTVTATDEFELDEEVNKLSQREGDNIRIVTDENQYYDYKYISPSRLYAYRYNKAVALIAEKRLRFSRGFTSSDPEFGSTISVPASIKLDDLVNLTDEILIDNPAWLPVMIAVHYVQSDAQLQYKYPDLLAHANDLMNGMKLANGSPDSTYSTGEDYFSNALGYGE